MRGRRLNPIAGGQEAAWKDARDLPALRRNLLAWYARHKRAMPWRGTRDAYRIWISEVMLQQTRVAAVLPYYRRFLHRFPGVAALARARQEEVLRHWAGLGYYSRARNLHRAAKEIVARHGGEFPRTREAALALPGIGRYTAAAILSIAYDEPLAVLDGNVARVLARFGALRGDLRAPRRWNQLQEAAQALLPIAGLGESRAARPGEWNQAMMELGATVCTPQSPRCWDCPVARCCSAKKLGLQDKIPPARKKHAPVKMKIAAAVLLDPRGRTLLVKENGARLNGLFSRMWQFPAALAKDSARAAIRRRMDENAAGRGSGKLRGPNPGEWELARGGAFRRLPAARHTVTFREISLRPYLVRVSKLPKWPDSCTVQLADMESWAVSSATRKIARAALEG